MSPLPLWLCSERLLSKGCFWPPPAAFQLKISTFSLWGCVSTCAGQWELMYADGEVNYCHSSSRSCCEEAVLFGSSPAADSAPRTLPAQRRPGRGFQLLQHPRGCLSHTHFSRLARLSQFLISSPLWHNCFSTEAWENVRTRNVHFRFPSELLLFSNSLCEDLAFLFSSPAEGPRKQVDIYFSDGGKHQIMQCRYNWFHSIFRKRKPHGLERWLCVTAGKAKVLVSLK